MAGFESTGDNQRVLFKAHPGFVEVDVTPTRDVATPAESTGIDVTLMSGVRVVFAAGFQAGGVLYRRSKPAAEHRRH